MAIATTIKEGATSVAATGGTDVSLSSLGIQNNRNTLTFSTDTSALLRRMAEFFVKLATPNASSPGGWTQSRKNLKVSFPKTLASGERSVNTVKIELAVHPETTQAEIEGYVEQCAQMLGTSAFLPFWRDDNLN